MPNQASNQTALGSYVYFFRSPSDGMHDCMIMGHGGVVHGKRFAVPPNVTVHYMSSYGKPIVLQKGPLASSLSGTVRSAWEHQKGPREIADQVLAKNLGKHWDDVPNRVTGEYYELVQERMSELHGNGIGPNWVPHVVTIRNRRFPNSNDAIWLSKVIELVRAHEPGITDFYPYACRGVVGDDWAKKCGAQGKPA